MGRRPKEPTVVDPEIRAKPFNPNVREKEMMALAFDLVEQRLRDGTATSQETTHFLKLATQQSKLELKRLEKDIELADAKIKTLESEQAAGELYEEAINAIRSYVSPATYAGLRDGEDEQIVP